jgi:ABC-type amino acid transport substrate-binding protein
METALGRVASFVVKLAPIGIFAIAAEAAGTLRIEEIGRAQVYLGTYVVAWAILSFWTLPALVAAATPFTYTEVMRHARTAMLTAFATNTVLVVLPMIAEECKKLLEEDGLETEETESTVDVLVPTAYTLPTAGTPISLAFVLFAAWFAGSPLGVEQYPSFSILGFLSSFGGMYLALPYLLDFFQLRADLFHLFVVGTFVTSQLWSSLAAMHGVALCLLGACAVTGRISWTRLAVAAGVSLVLTAVAFQVLSYAFDDLVPDQDQGEERLLSLQLAGQQVEVDYPSVPLPLTRRDRGRDRLEVIRERGTLKVGYVAETPPFVHRNVHGETVGLDMDLLHALAGDLDVSLSILEVGEFAADYWLDVGGVDILVGGIAMTPERALSAAFSRPYIDETPAFIVPDHERGGFRTIEALRDVPDLRIAVPKRFQFPAIRQYLPNATFVDVQSPKHYLLGQVEGLDAMLYSAEVGSAWTLLYPEFSVAVPTDMNVTVPTAWLLPVDSGHLLNFVNSWIEVHRDLGLIERSRRYWIMGKGDESRQTPRWSVIRDVLHWVE